MRILKVYVEYDNIQLLPSHEVNIESCQFNGGCSP